MSNLLEETLGELNNNGKSPSDVLWVGSKGEPRHGKFCGTWIEFAALADHFDYDDGYGGANINTELVVVGPDWWLERGEYDGSEWWEFKTLPAKQENMTPIRRADLDEVW